jgi:hypothetical protein
MSEEIRPYRTGPQEPETTELYRAEGDSPRCIRVYVDHHGDLELGSQDFPSERLRGFVGGATEYEYFVTVQAEAKDRLLLALLVEKYKGDERAVEAFREWCEARSIPCRFDVWGSGHFD